MVDVYQTVKKMRQQRTVMVQTRVRIIYDVVYTEMHGIYLVSFRNKNN